MKLLIGEPLALDLVNTVTLEGDGLDAHWFQLEGLEAADLTAARALRAHVRAALDAVRQAASLPEDAVEAINHAARTAPPYKILSVDRQVEIRRDPLAQLAEAAIDLLSGPDVGKIRACGGPGCRMLFLARHPRRQWCSPEICGNRVRVARHYQRHVR